MNGETARLIVGLTVILAFTGMIAAVLFGLVDIKHPEVAKLVGSVFGYLTGLVTPVVMRYFKENGR